MATVLIVDDEFLIAQALECTLRRAGHEVRLAPNGADALRMLDSYPAEIVITDFMMPRMDGVQFIDRLRTSPQIADLKVVLMSAVEKDEIGCPPDAYDCFLPKPVSGQQIVDLVDHLSDR